MRPPLLNPLFATVRSLKGVGPKVEALLNKLVAPSHALAHARVIDLLWHLPVGVVDRTITPRSADARIGELATLEVTVTEHRSGSGRRGGRAPYKVLVEDFSGAALELVYFNADPGYLRRLLPVGSRRLVSGKVESYDGWLQMPHPDHVMNIEGPRDAAAVLPLHEPIYPLTAGLTNTMLRKAIGVRATGEAAELHHVGPGALGSPWRWGGGTRCGWRLSRSRRGGGRRCSGARRLGGCGLRGGRIRARRRRRDERRRLFRPIVHGRAARVRLVRKLDGVGA